MKMTAAIVLAAGLGTRMGSDQPKVLRVAAGRTLIGHVLEAVKALKPDRTLVVVGPGQTGVESEARRYQPDAETIVQTERKGTGHAVQMTLPHLETFAGTVLVLFGDCPNITPHSLKDLVGQVTAKTPLAVLAFRTEKPEGYGRLIVKKGHLVAIREELDASKREKAVTVCNSGIMAIDAALLRNLLPRLGNNNAKGEYYLTDLISLAAKMRKRITFSLCSEFEALGVNTRAELARVEAELQKSLRRQAMEQGVSFIAPETVFLSADTKIGREVTIEPYVVLGPGVVIADNVTIRSFCHIEGSEIAGGAVIGPYARLRAGSEIGPRVHIGNFVETKKAAIEEGAKINHLSYVGDARVGARSNIGAGAITCNYDGVGKYFTDIGKDAFIGTNSSLVAPVKIGDGAYVGSGSVITRNVEPDSLAIERSEQTTKPGWASRFKAARKARMTARKVD